MSKIFWLTSLLVVSWSAIGSDRSMDSLEENFRTKVELLVEKTVSMGFQTRVVETYRSPKKQKAIYALSKILPGVAVTSVKVSQHSHTRDGKPSACAVDIRTDIFLSTADQAKFYKVLRNNAKELGLKSGADYKPRITSPFYEYDLGWDPGHIYKFCR